ncbi:hypothetical protein J6590_056784 [Homalodisca vitripennis]|nr:hypothetical protein J6590_056784 [Homalodisca vitripennis]
MNFLQVNVKVVSSSGPWNLEPRGKPGPARDRTILETCACYRPAHTKDQDLPDHTRFLCLLQASTYQRPGLVKDRGLIDTGTYRKMGSRGIQELGISSSREVLEAENFLRPRGARGYALLEDGTCWRPGMQETGAYHIPKDISMLGVRISQRRGAGRGPSILKAESSQRVRVSH